jgi:type I restriction enzyme S subunit
MNQRPVGWALAPVNMLHDTDGLFADGDWIESKDQDINGTNRLIQLADIGDGYFIDKSARFVNDEKFTTLNCTEIKSGDVLIARMPDPLGRACIFPKIEQRCLTVVDIAIFRPGSNGVQNTWFMYWVNSPAIRSLINLNASGTTRKRISRGNLSAMELPVPPLPEQKRIADKLDATLARVDACRERLARVAPILKRFRQSVLAAAVSGRLTADWRTQQAGGDNIHLTTESPDQPAGIEPASDKRLQDREANKSSYERTKQDLHANVTEWQYLTAETVCDKVQSGGTPKAGFSSDGIPFLKVYNIVNQQIDFNYRPQFVEKSVHETELKKSQVQPGDVLMNIVGPPLGKVAVVPLDPHSWNINQAITLFRPSNRITTGWLYILLPDYVPTSATLSKVFLEQGFALMTATASLGSIATRSLRRLNRYCTSAR